MGQNPKNQISMYEGFHTSMEIDANGVPYVVFADWENLNGRLSVRKFESNRWITVGAPGISVAHIDYPKIDIDNSGTPYVVYMDDWQNNQIVVKKYNGTSWVNVGLPGFAGGRVKYTNIAIDNMGVPYVAFMDDDYGDKATVMKFDGSNWVFVGSRGITASGVSDISLKIGPGNNPYICFSDQSNGFKVTVMSFIGGSWNVVGSSSVSQYQGRGDVAFDTLGTVYVAYLERLNVNSSDNLVVKKFNGSNWVLVGGTRIKKGKLERVSIETDTLSNSIYVAYSDQNNGSRVVRLDGASWLPVGKYDFSFGTALYGGLKVDAAGALYYVYSSPQNNDKANLMRFDGSEWSSLGDMGLAEQTVVAYTTMDLDSSGVPYVAFQDYAQGNRLTVMKYNGSSWSPVGSRGFSPGEIDEPVLVVDKNSTPYVLFEDHSNGTVKATVMKFDGQNWVMVGAGFPVGTVEYTSIVIDSSGVPCVSFRVAGGLSKAYRFNGATWGQLGASGYSGSAIGLATLATHKDDVYIAYQDQLYSNRLTVERLEGNVWVPIGTRGFRAGSKVNLVIDSAGVPYVGFLDSTVGNRITVMKFDGNSWALVGNSGFSAFAVNDVDLVLDGSDQPYVVYSDNQYHEKVTAMRFNDTSWVVVGTAGFSTGSIDYPQIKIDNNDQPIVAFADGGAWAYKFTSDCVPTAAKIKIEACDSYVSPSVSQTWFTSGVYQDTLIDMNNCDSILTIELELNQSTMSWDSVEACRSFFYNLNSKLYSQSVQDTIVVQNSKGCDSLVFLDLNIRNIDTTIQQLNDTLWAKTMNASYQWLDCNDSYSVIAGETQQFFIPQTAGRYAVQVADSFCIDTSSCIAFSGIDIAQNDLVHLNIYPNPTTDFVLLELPSEDVMKISLYSSTGTLMREWGGVKGQFSLDMRSQASGVYCLKVVSENISISEMIIKQ